MSAKIKRGVAVVHYNRLINLSLILESVKNTVPEGTKVVLCDDGSKPIDNYSVESIADKLGIILLKGPNLGVAANKNRALWALQDCTFLAIIEDDLYPKEKGWFEIYETACKLSEIHHFCRVQPPKEVEELVPDFRAFMQSNSLTPIYGSSVRGDFTFITSSVVRRVGGFNPEFRGAGYAHGIWSDRVFKAGLIGHPLKWVDIKEARDKFEQIGDTQGGRWDAPKEETTNQLTINAEIAKGFRTLKQIYYPLVLE